MTGPEHYAEAERLLALADRHHSGATYGQEWAITISAAHVHATLALAAATAIGTAGPEAHHWADVAAARPAATKPQSPGGSTPGSRPARRPPPLFPPPPEDKPPG
jgi:hypothetical protein